MFEGEGGTGQITVKLSLRGRAVAGVSVWRGSNKHNQTEKRGQYEFGPRLPGGPTGNASGEFQLDVLAQVTCYIFGMFSFDKHACLLDLPLTILS